MTQFNLQSFLDSVIPQRLSRRMLQPGSVVFCDFDGPIVDVSARYYCTYQQSLEAVRSQLPLSQQGQLQPLSQSQFWQLKCDRVPDADIATASGLPPEYFDLFMDTVQQVVNSPELLDLDVLQVGVVAALSQLCQHGIQVMIVSLRQQAQIEQMLSRWGLRNFVCDVFGADSDTAAYLNHADHKTALLQQAIAAARSRGWQPGWMIGDTEADILAAQATRLPAAAITSGIRSHAYLEQFQPTLVTGTLHAATRSLLHPPSVLTPSGKSRWLNLDVIQPRFC